MKKTTVCDTGLCLLVGLALVALLAPSAQASPVWLAPVGLASAAPDGTTSPRVAFDTWGNAVALWESPDNSVQAAFRLANEDLWQTPVVLAQGLGTVGEADLAVDPASGAAVGAWTREGTVQLATGSVEEDRWAMPATLPIAGDQVEHPRVAIDAQGAAIASWVSEGLNGFRVYTNAQSTYRTASDTGWPLPEVLPDVTPYHAGGLSPAFDAQGDALVMWVQSAMGVWTIEASSRPAGEGSWRAPVAVSAAWPVSFPRPREREGPLMSGVQVAFDGRGDSVAVWEHYISENWFVEAAVRPASSEAWQPPTRLSTSGLGGARPSLALDATGDAVVVWEGATASERTVEAATGSAVSGGWHAPTRIAAWRHRKEFFAPWSRRIGYEGGPPPARPSVALDAHGNAVAVWEHALTHTTGAVQASRLPAGSGAWQRPVDIASASAEGVQVASAPDGEALAIWDRLIKGAGGVVEASALAKLAITNAHMAAARVRVEKPRPGAGRKRAVRGGGTAFDFILSEAAEVKVAFTHTIPGVQRYYDGICQPPSHGPTALVLRPCRRRVTVATLTHPHLSAGFHSLRFDGRVDGHALTAGAYRAVLTANTAAGHSLPVTLSFRVVG